MSSHPDTNNNISISNVLRSIFQIFLRGCCFQVSEKDSVTGDVQIQYQRTIYFDLTGLFEKSLAWGDFLGVFIGGFYRSRGVIWVSYWFGFLVVFCVKFLHLAVG
jgi:hypothetical protein